MAADVNEVIASGRWGPDRRKVLEQISNAAETLVNAATDQQIIFVGKKFQTPLGAWNGNSKQTLIMTLGDLIDFPQYLIGYDILWRRNKYLDEYSKAFHAFSSEEYVSDILIRRKEFEVIQKSYRGAPKFTDAERANWIKNYQGRNGDKAYRDFRQEPKYDGTKQAHFRNEWTKIRQQPRGRPRVNS